MSEVIFLNLFQAEAETNTYNLPTMPDSDDSEEGNSCNIIIDQKPVFDMTVNLNWTFFL